MEGLFTQTDKALDEMGQCAVAITGDEANTHSGLLLRFPDDPVVYMLHLQTTNLNLTCLAGCPLGCLWGVPNIHEARLGDLVTKAILVQDVNKATRVPYGFSVPDGFFDDKTGKILPGEDKVGLTCATFILAVFHMTGITLINYDSWKPRKADCKAQVKLYGNLKKYKDRLKIKQVELNNIRNQIKGIRYRPEEVIAASMTDSKINTMRQLEPLGREVVEQILNQPVK